MKETSKGLLFGLSSYAAWGILPIYWKCLSFISPLEILANRFILSVIFVAIVIVASGKTKFFLSESKFIFTNLKRTLALIGASFAIAINWGTFIWAVNSGHILSASFGYYMNPIVSVLLGIFILKEKLNVYQAIAFALSGCGVLNMLWQLGQFPYISLVLAISFGFYGLIKKLLPVSVLTTIMLESALLTPLMLGYEYYLANQNLSAYQSTTGINLFLLLCAGAITAIPLMLFTAGAKRLPLKVMGFLQYISPTMTMILGIFVYKETFNTAYLISFCFIWLGLIIFSTTSLRNSR
jgi:chloramphenicol-sensitive protein RarD